jgi:hypothetical protein
VRSCLLLLAQRSRLTPAPCSGSWGLVTIVVGRLLLRLRAFDSDVLAPATRRKAPFFAGTRASTERVGTRSQTGSKRASEHSTTLERWEMESCGGVEIGKVELVVHHR